MRYAKNNQYDYVYLINQDAWIFRDTLEILIHTQKKNPQYGILSPFQMQSSMRGLDKNFAAGTCSYLSNSHLLSDFYLGNVKEVYEVPMVMAAHWLVSKACFEKVGGFSPSFSHYAEDDNYAQRARFHGFLIGIVPSSKAIHDRECRTENKQHSIYMGYVTSVKMLSSPYATSCIKENLFIHQLTLKKCLKFRSFLPLAYYFKLVLNLRRIRSNKHLSRIKDGAFLEDNDSS